MKDSDFDRTCIQEGRLRELPTVTERERYAEDFRRLSNRKLRAAEHLLGTDAEAEAVGEAYFSMEHKANELLARHGWRSKSHVCTIVALSRLLQRRDLAQTLQRAYEDRQVFDYTADPGTMRSADSFGAFIEVAHSFRAAIDAMLAPRE